MKNMRRLAGKFDLDQSERKSSQVNASARTEIVHFYLHFGTVPINPVI